LRRFVVEEGLAETVTFAGRQVDVASFLRCADIFLFPSHREGMPNVLLEAMSSGLACVASAIGGSTDLIDNGKSGYLFPVEDEEGMAEAVTELLTVPERAAELGAAARKVMEQKFSIAVTTERYARLYRELLSEPHSPALQVPASPSDKL
jgi:glycosyltransferase involved in cell wall biosynthesis